MNGRFESEDDWHRPFPKQSGLTAWVQKMGFAKDARQAQYILLAVAVSAALIAVFFFARQFPVGKSHFSGRQVQQLIQQGKYPIPQGVKVP